MFVNVYYNGVCCLLLEGDIDEVYDVFLKLFELGFSDIELLKMDSDFDVL